MNFPGIFAEARLISDYGPAFADGYSYQEKVRTARILKTIRQLHRLGTDKW